MIILSIETSCDETAAAIVKFSDNKAEVLANVVSSQVKAHSKFGGVVPSLASRMHLKNMVPVLRRAFRQAGKKGFPKKLSSKASEFSFFGNLIDCIAITNGPGLIPALMVGTQAAKTLSYALKKPLIPINHIEGHIYANWLRPICENPKSQNPNPKQIPNKSKITNYQLPITNYQLQPDFRQDSKLPVANYQLQDYKLWNPKFPILCLIVSGGHTQLILMKKDLDYEIVGETLDDAAGEAFDKVAKLLKLGYPGGPIIEKMARKGDGNKFKFPRPMMNSKDYNFSFSGLKTAVLYKWNLEFGILNLENEKTNAKLQSFDAGFNSARLQNLPNPPYQGRCSMFKVPIINYQLHPDFRQDSGFKIQNSKFKSDIAASFQRAVIDVLVSKTVRAAKEYKAKNIILGGGVSANKELQKQLREAINKELPITNYQLPITSLSTDNALMIAVAGYYHILNNKNVSDWKNVKTDANLKLN